MSSLQHPKMHFPISKVIKRFEWHWRMRGTASLTSGTNTQTKGTDGLNDRRICRTIKAKIGKMTESQSAGKEKPLNQREPTWRGDIHIKAAHQSVGGHKKTLEKPEQTHKERQQVAVISHHSHSSQFSQWAEMREDKGLILLSMSVVDKEGLLLSEHASHTHWFVHCCNNPNLLLTICVLLCHCQSFCLPAHI